MNFNEIIYPRKVYQDTRNSNPLWRQPDLIMQPLTEGQYRDRFRVGERVTIRIKNHNRKMYLSGLIKHILPYDITWEALGQYNIDNTLNTIPFTRVLVLVP